MSIFRSMGFSASGMSVERFRMDVTAENLSHAGNAASRPGEIPFCRQLVEVQSTANGPQVVRTMDHPDGLMTENIPGHPGANPDGDVLMTNVNPVTEMVDMMSATRAYEANVKAFNAAKSMAKSALEIGKA
jgi:flagellar basal-body rod protein FlgC